MATFALFPEAWIGGWAWSGVARDLRGQGRDAYPLILTGLRERPLPGDSNPTKVRTPLRPASDVAQGSRR
jgi:hypothetical protein